MIPTITRMPTMLEKSGIRFRPSWGHSSPSASPHTCPGSVTYFLGRALLVLSGFAVVLWIFVGGVVL